MQKYAIINKETKEFYADPIYTDIEKAKRKIEYLENYEKEHNMKLNTYEIEVLTPERETQHEKEWKQFCNAID
jgi:hypothetical protein